MTHTRSRKTRLTNRKNQGVDNRDVTINEYANASRPVGRDRKCNTLAVEEGCGEGGQDADDDVPLSWEQRAAPRAAEALGEDGAGGEGGGRHYPEVLFYLLAQYIAPEDVARFALVNRAAHAATERESFWRALYARHVARAPRAAALPPHLCLDRAPRSYGLRARVVCALHRVHPPFLAQKRTESPVNALVGRRCVDLWYERRGAGWLYCVKLRASPGHRAAPAPAPGADLAANTERDCCALLVRCAQLESVAEPPLGLRLVATRVSAAAADGCRLRRLRLAFSAGPPCAAPPPLAPDLSLLLHTVQEVRTVRWWERDYPAFRLRAPAPPLPAAADLRGLL